MAFSFKRARRHVLAVALALCAAPAFAQSAWPEKPIRLVVPFPPGGPTDTASRILGQELGKALNQTVVVENRAGASGTIAASAVARSDADGYTFMMLATPTLLAPHLYPSTKVDIQKEFDPVAKIYDLPLVIVVNPKVLDVSSVQEMIAKAKEEKGMLNYTSAGVGSFGHLSMELLKQMGGVEMTHVPYGGSAPAVTDLLGGQIPIMYADLVAALPHVKAGTLRALAVGSPERVPMLPETPTISEQGFPGFSAVSWGGLVAPAGTPKEIIDRVSKEAEAILAQPAVQERLMGAGAIAMYGSPEAMAARIKEDNDKWGALVREKGISAN